MNAFVRKQLKFFPNGMIVIDHSIVLVGDLFYSVIIENNIPMDKMPPAQFSALLLDHDEIFKRFTEGTKKNIMKLSKISRRCMQ